jgi:hypothetical protein
MLVLQLRYAGKLDGCTASENVPQPHTNLTDWTDAVEFIFKTDDCIGIDIFGVANKLIQSKLVGHQWPHARPRQP